MRKVLGTVVMATMLVVVGSAAACQVVTECGTVVSRDATLTQDITGCAGDALVIGADDITLDLNGHTVSSDDGVGIRLAGQDGVTIKEGTVEGTTAGLALSDASHLAVVRVRAVAGDEETRTFDEVGMLLERVNDSRISQSTAAGFDSFVLRESHGNRIRRSVGTSSYSDGGDTLRLEGSHFNRITENRLALQAVSNSSVVVVDSDHTFIADNTIRSQDGNGIAVSRSGHTVIRRNDLSSGANLLTISVFESPDMVIADNVGSAFDEGVRIRDSDRMVMRANEVASIRLEGSNDAVVDLNAVSGVDFLDDAISVSEDSSSVRVSANRASGAPGDGIDVDAPGTVVRDNVATDNGDLGIEAVAGVVDGGGNQASGNGNPAQCTGVACTPPPA